jgi:tetratricopeptide (TPR) repeat protein
MFCSKLRSEIEIEHIGVSWAWLQNFIKQPTVQFSTWSCFKKTLPVVTEGFDFQQSTTKQVCDHVIKPPTMSQLVSFAKLQSPKDVRLANAFVSHAWSGKFENLISALTKWVKNKQPPPEGWFFWIDIFVVNQHSNISDFGYWSTGFKKALKAIGRAVIVLSPWNQPAWAGRAWCLYEFNCIVELGIPHDFVLSEEDTVEFVSSLRDDGNRFLEVVSQIDMEKADAWNKDDLNNIKIEVQKTVGFAKLNETVIGALRGFFVHESMLALSTMTDQEKSESNLLYNTASLQTDVGDLSSALQLYEVDLQLKTAKFGHSVSVANTKVCMGVVYRKLGNNEEALKMYDEALTIEEKCLGNCHVSVAMTLENIAIVHKTLGNMEEAKRLYGQAHAIFLQCLGPDHHNTQKAARGLASF